MTIRRIHKKFVNTEKVTDNIKERSGRKRTVRTPIVAQQIQDCLAVDRKVSAANIARRVGI
jgi:hypothetical protein